MYTIVQKNANSLRIAKKNRFILELLQENPNKYSKETNLTKKFLKKLNLLVLREGTWLKRENPKRRSAGLVKKTCILKLPSNTQNPRKIVKLENNNMYWDFEIFSIVDKGKTITKLL